MGTGTYSLVRTVKAAHRALGHRDHKDNVVPMPHGPGGRTKPPSPVTGSRTYSPKRRQAAGEGRTSLAPGWRRFDDLCDGGVAMPDRRLDLVSPQVGPDIVDQGC